MLSVFEVCSFSSIFFIKLVTGEETSLIVEEVRRVLSAGDGVLTAFTPPAAVVTIALSESDDKVDTFWLNVTLFVNLLEMGGKTPDEMSRFEASTTEGDVDLVTLISLTFVFVEDVDKVVVAISC